MQTSWVEEKDPILMVGAGMAGISAAFQLQRLGITNVLLLDENPEGKEGPWTTYARMRHLRSGKELEGPAHFTPEMNFKSFYSQKYGPQQWEEIYKISNQDWNDYLVWLKQSLHLHVENNVRVLKIEEKEERYYLHTTKGMYETNRVVLSTGRMGFGGLRLPHWIDKLPRGKWAHSSEKIDFLKLKGLKVAIVGVGASAFDAAAAALESGAHVVDMLTRRDHINNVNKAAGLTYSGFELGFFYLSDQDKLSFSELMKNEGAVPPFESILRVLHHQNFTIRYSFDFEKYLKDYDFFILATGFLIDASKAPFLDRIAQKIELWENYMSEEEKKKYPFALRYPYLGPHFEIRPFRGLYCFNQAAFLSHGLIAGDIPGIGTGAERLAQGIAIDLFIQNKEIYYQKLKDYKTEEFDPALLINRKN